MHGQKHHHQRQRHQDQRPPNRVHFVHPPFPSFAWVMTTQSNPPSKAYAYGYAQNANRHHHTHVHKHKHIRGLGRCIPTHRAARVHRGRSNNNNKPIPRSTRPSPSPSPQEKLMETVDYRFHDPRLPAVARPSYKPWRHTSRTSTIGMTASTSQRSTCPVSDLRLEEEGEDDVREEEEEKIKQKPVVVASAPIQAGAGTGASSLMKAKRLMYVSCVFCVLFFFYPSPPPSLSFPLGGRVTCYPKHTVRLTCTTSSGLWPF
ncbi:hypothetical protein B0F90DRAFT_728866 [Multifurca ochricompacta]|uniref:Uncharacterized protein n=1 Tax=Multifurca ochricompacta TaxID=376703 RepID=A0AAD4MAG9_9AGAM|nr:hypothetical protein B0F90DRAFT_728866 [Multifurca ochricompacta]